MNIFLTVEVYNILSKIKQQYYIIYTGQVTHSTVKQKLLQKNFIDSSIRENKRNTDVFFKENSVFIKIM